MSVKGSGTDLLVYLAFYLCSVSFKSVFQRLCQCGSLTLLRMTKWEDYNNTRG